MKLLMVMQLLLLNIPGFSAKSHSNCTVPSGGLTPIAQEDAGKCRVGLIVGGVMKGGTRFLHDLFSAHPGLCTARKKEGKYFSCHDAKSWYAEGLHNYNREVCGPKTDNLIHNHKGECGVAERHRTAASKSSVCFEKSPDYMSDKMAMARAARDCPKAKWLLILREPISRMVSHFHHIFRQATKKKNDNSVIQKKGNHICAFNTFHPTQLQLHRLKPLLAGTEEQRKLWSHWQAAVNTARLASSNASKIYSSAASAWDSLEFTCGRGSHSAYERSLYARSIKTLLKHIPRSNLHVVFSEELRETRNYTAIWNFLGVEDIAIDMKDAKANESIRGDAAETLVPSTIRWLQDKFAHENAKLEVLLGRKNPASWEYPVYPVSLQDEGLKSS